MSNTYDIEFLIYHLPDDLQRLIYSMYLDTIASYEERILLKAPPRKLNLTPYERKISPLLQKPESSYMHLGPHNDWCSVVKLRYRPPIGLPSLAKLVQYTIGRDNHGNYVTETARLI